MILLIPHGFEPNYTLGFARGLKATGVEVLLAGADDDAARAAATGSGLTGRLGLGSHDGPGSVTVAGSESLSH